MLCFLFVEDSEVLSTHRTQVHVLGQEHMNDNRKFTNSHVRTTYDAHDANK